MRETKAEEAWAQWGGNSFFTTPWQEESRRGTKRKKRNENEFGKQGAEVLKNANSLCERAGKQFGDTLKF